MKGTNILNDIIDYIEEIRSHYPNIADDVLLDNGTIKYMNGDDGTDFDWDMNHRCCEFCLLFKESKRIFIKVLVFSNDTMVGYAFEDADYDSGEKMERTELESGDALFLASLLVQEADEKNLFDADITRIDFDAEVSHLLRTPHQNKVSEYEDYDEDYDEYSEEDDRYDDYYDD